MYRVLVLPAAARELAELDKLVGRRIVKRINWLAETLELARLEALTADLAGFYKLHVGDYRVLYELLHAERTLVVHAIGHRRKIYRRP